MCCNNNCKISTIKVRIKRIDFLSIIVAQSKQYLTQLNYLICNFTFRIFLIFKDKKDKSISYIYLKSFQSSSHCKTINFFLVFVRLTNIYILLRIYCTASIIIYDDNVFSIIFNLTS